MDFLERGAVAAFVAFAIERIGLPGKVVSGLGRMPRGNQRRSPPEQSGRLPVLQFGHRQVALGRGGCRGSGQLRVLGPLSLLAELSCFLRRSHLHLDRLVEELPRFAEVATFYGSPRLSNKISRLGIVRIERGSLRLEFFELVCHLGQLL